MYKKLLFTIFVSTFFIACTATKETKPTQLDASCLKKPNPGKCRAYFPKYYFDSNDSTCKKFIWGGCGGSVPFQTLKECKSTCE